MSRTATPPEERRHWLGALGHGVRDRVTWVLLAIGLGSGLPLGWAWYNLPWWSGYDAVVPTFQFEALALVTTFTSFTLVGLIGFFVAPLLDRRPAPCFRSLGHRRGWVATLLATALVLTLCFVAIDLVLSPALARAAAFIHGIVALAAMALLVVAIDAFRIEIRPGRVQAIAFGGQFLGAWLAQYLGLLSETSDGLSLPYAALCALTLALALWAVLQIAETEPPRKPMESFAHVLAGVPAVIKPLEIAWRGLVRPWAALFERHGRLAACVILAAIAFYALAASATNYIGTLGFLSELAGTRDQELIERVQSASQSIAFIMPVLPVLSALAGIAIALSMPPARAFEFLLKLIAALALVFVVLRLATGHAPAAVAFVALAAAFLGAAKYIVYAVVAAGLTARPHTAGQFTLIGLFASVFWLSSAAYNRIVAEFGALAIAMIAIMAAFAAILCMRAAGRIARRNAKAQAAHAAGPAD